MCGKSDQRRGAFPACGYDGRLLRERAGAAAGRGVRRPDGSITRSAASWPCWAFVTEALVAGALAGYGIAVPMDANGMLIVTPRQRLLTTYEPTREEVGAPADNE